MVRATELFLRYDYTALVFRPGRDGRPVARLGRLVVLPGRRERVQVGAPYRPARFIDRERSAIAVGLRPVTRTVTATVRGGMAVGWIATLPWETVPFELPTRLPDHPAMIGRVVQEGDVVLFAPISCTRCGAVATHEIGAGREYLCDSCYQEWWESLAPPENGPNPFGEDVGYMHSFESDW